MGCEGASASSLEGPCISRFELGPRGAEVRGDLESTNTNLACGGSSESCADAFIPHPSPDGFFFTII